MADFPFPRLPRRDDPFAALTVQKNIEDFANALLSPKTYFPPEKPRRDDPLMHLVVDRNLRDAASAVLDPSQLPFFFPYVVRRNDHFAAMILQKNLEALVRAA